RAASRAPCISSCGPIRWHTERDRTRQTRPPGAQPSAPGGFILQDGWSARADPRPAAHTRRPQWNRLRACAVTAKAKDRRNQEHRSMTATTVRLALVALACAVAAPASAQLLQRKELSYPIALTIAQAALEDCKARGYATSVVVVDRGGNT